MSDVEAIAKKIALSYLSDAPEYCWVYENDDLVEAVEDMADSDRDRFMEEVYDQVGEYVGLAWAYIHDSVR